MGLLNTLIFAAMSALALPAFATNIPAASIDKLTKLDGSAFKTDKNKMAVYFWATWCPDCKEKLSGEFNKMPLPADLQFVTVNTDKDVKRTQHMVEKEKWTVTVLRDEDKEVAKALKVFSVPFWAVLARQPDNTWKIIESESGGNMEKMKAAWTKN